MSVGFGFSVGDFIAALQLVGIVIDALRESSHSSTSFRLLINELYTLESALLRVKRLELDSERSVEVLALRQAASQCQRTIDAFWKKAQKYQPHLQRGGTDSKLKDNWMKIKWAVYKKDDLETFRRQIRAHTSSIEILLLTVHMDTTTIEARRQDIQSKSLAGHMQDLMFQVMGKLSTITSSVTDNVRQGKQLIESSASIMQTNLRVFQMVYDIQLFIRRIPGQVQRQQPVYLIDAYNRESPFHLEFVRSANALLAVLKVNLEDSGCGPEMIDRREFVIEESGTQMAIDLSRPWDALFYPGQRVAMSMVFKLPKEHEQSCPRCNKVYNEPANKEITCIVCGIVFRRIEEILDEASNANDSAKQTSDSKRSSSQYIYQEEPTEGTRYGPFRTAKRKREDDIAANLAKFRRVQIKQQAERTREKDLDAFTFIADYEQFKRMLAECEPLDRGWKFKKKTRQF